MSGGETYTNVMQKLPVTLLFNTLWAINVNEKAKNGDFFAVYGT